MAMAFTRLIRSRTWAGRESENLEIIIFERRRQDTDRLRDAAGNQLKIRAWVFFCGASAR